VLCCFRVEIRFWTGGELVSFIGSLDQFDLSIILQKIEEYHKTGLLAVTQDGRSVELSFKQGQFMCVGPVRPHISLGDRLLQAEVISEETRRAVEFALGENRYSEVEAAVAFLNGGYVDKASLYRWAAIEAQQVLDALLAWQTGDIYFEADVQPPANRLQIALSITSLLSALLNVSPVPVTPPKTAIPSQSSYPVTEIAPPIERDTDTMMRLGNESRPVPQRAPTRINVAVLQPDMVLAPADLSAYRESNPPVHLTPDQWRLFTRADGQTTLLVAAHELGMSRNQVCQAAADLAGLGLVLLSQSGNSPTDFQYGAVAQQGAAPIPLPAYPMQGYATLSSSNYQPGRPPIETQSQWGNGGNGATFVLGNGWVVAPPQNIRPYRNTESYPGDRVFAKAG